MPHLFVDISSHGFGHLAQVAPILNELTSLLPELRLTVRSGLPAEKMQARISAPFMHLSERSDFGFVMLDAVRINEAATADAYRCWHADWEKRVEDEADKLRLLAPDLVLTDAAYLPLAGAAWAGIPSLSMCSLNWADLFAHVFGKEPWAKPVHDEILAAYRSAECFLRLTPAMPMADLPRTHAIAPVAALGQDRRRELCTRLDIAPDERVVLIAFGGFDKDLNAGQWPKTPGVRWLIPESWALERNDMTAFEPLQMNFTDLLRSVDAVLTKPGYGTFTEAACNGTPVLFVRRKNWPEQDCLIEWLQAHARFCEVDEAALQAGQWQPLLDALWRQPAPPLPSATGARQASEFIASRLTLPASGRQTDYSGSR